jgi:DNA-binding NtrC family response regulator
MNILVITEDSSYKLHLRKYLVDEGYNVILAKDVREGIRLIKSEKVDLVISDLAMKYMDGFDFCNKAREILAGKEIPFIFISIYIDEITKMKADLLKNSGLLKKGSSVSETLAMIKHLTSPNERGDELLSNSDSSIEIPQVQNDTSQKNKANQEDGFFNSRILLVDDDDSFRKVLGDTLSDEGYTDITSAIDGGEAIVFLQAQHFDLVLLDIIMPNVSGFGVLKFIHENKPSTKVIMITAYADMKLAVEAKQLGAADFIAKPFMRDDLFQTIKQVLSQ